MTQDTDVGWSRVSLEGPIDLTTVQAAYERIKSAAETGAALEIDLRDVTGLDLTLVQLIESARRTAADADIAIRLAAPAAGAVLETLQRGGFLSDPPDARTQFWLAQAAREDKG
jgi:ABC-type transporter Mla MlaB component